jgi:hypothetical protein
MEVRRLESTEDVTAKVRAAVMSTDDAKSTRSATAIAALENEWRKTGLRRGGGSLDSRRGLPPHRQDLERRSAGVCTGGALGFFGGDPDNLPFRGSISIFADAGV